MTNKEAIKILEELADCCNYEIVIDSEDVEALNNAIESLKNERPHGEWIKKVDDDGSVSYICSECGLEDCSDTCYCSDCGAKMKVRR